MGARVYLYYLATVKASYRVSVSLNSRRRLFWRLTSEIIKHNHVVLNTQ